MNSIAAQLNQVLEGSVAEHLLSDLGKRMYFPKGIVAQSAEAKAKATRFNATVGMATTGSKPMCLPSIYERINGLSEADVFSYAPTAGDAKLRAAWKQQIYSKNPSLSSEVSLPVVTSGLTHGILLAADLFLDKGDAILVPDMFWGNYRLIFEERREASILSFPFFDESGELNLEALEQRIDGLSGDKVALILNFPNNPTGYSPSVREAEALAALLTSKAQKGKRILVITDDAYFGLFYEQETCKESLFAYLADAHENILAVKVDGSTKEDFVWGFRVGFMTYGCKGWSEAQYTALVQKTMGAVRSSISNCSRPAQSLLLLALEDPGYQAQKDAAFEVLKQRYLKVKEVLASHADDQLLKPLPFNSGYFMTFCCEGDAEVLRLHLLDTYGIGAISIQGTYLRIAFSSVDVEQIEELYDMLYKAAGEAWS